jgi:phage terminase large subunit-like protein
MLTASDRDAMHRLDPVRWVKECLDMDLDDWQADAIRSDHRRIMLLCSRQAGKSTAAALRALHRVIFYPGSLVLLVSAGLHQSSELFMKVMHHLDQLEARPRLTEENKLSIVLANGSRIVSLRQNEAKIRGYSAVDLIIEDEAAEVKDDMYSAVRPMLATRASNRERSNHRAVLTWPALRLDQGPRSHRAG